MQGWASGDRFIEWHAARGFPSTGAVSGRGIRLPGGDDRVRGFAYQDNAHGRPGAGVLHPAAGAVRLVRTLRVGKAGGPEEGKSGRGAQAGKKEKRGKPRFSRRLIRLSLRSIGHGMVSDDRWRAFVPRTTLPPAVGKSTGKCVKGGTRDWSSRGRLVRTRDMLSFSWKPPDRGYSRSRERNRFLEGEAQNRMLYNVLRGWGKKGVMP